MGARPDAKDDTPRPRSRTFFRIRVAILLTILVGVLLWAWRDVHSRRARRDWDHTLDVAVVLLRTTPMDAAPVHALEVRLATLDAQLSAEMKRYRPDAPKPFAFAFFGPVDVATAPPEPDGDGVIDLAKHSWSMSRYMSTVDAAAAFDPSAFDVRIYVLVRPPTSALRQMVEGFSEQDGRIGTVSVELDVDSADFALLVVAHELFHTLGATDKYDAQGHSLVPLGLAEPERSPLFPQSFVEIMARNRPVSASEERVPERLAELRVGPTTAREIGWAR